MVSALWPMQMRSICTPSSRKIRTCSRPCSPCAQWCVLMGQPVRLHARAAARSTRSCAGLMPSSSFATLIAPALMSVSSMPTSISRTKMSALASMSRTANERGTSRQMPVATTTCIPEARETSATNRTSRPRSGVVRSMMVSTPPAFVARSEATARARAIPVEEPRIVRAVLALAGHHMLVAEREAQQRVRQRPERRLDSCHCPSSLTPCTGAQSSGPRSPGLPAGSWCYRPIALPEHGMGEEML